MMNGSLRRLTFSRRILFVLAAAICAATGRASAQEIRPIRVAVPEFIAGTPAEADVAHRITAVVVADLDRSGRFSLIDRAAYLETISNFNDVPRFADWRAIDARFLLTGRVASSGESQLSVAFHLWDVGRAVLLVGELHFAKPGNWNEAAHAISEAVYHRLAAMEGLRGTADLSHAGGKLRVAITNTDTEQREFVRDDPGIWEHKAP
jgi:TolB protein